MRENSLTGQTAGFMASIFLLAATWSASAKDLTELSIEELIDVEVTSVGKKSQALADAAAAVFVISNDDIRRSGATSVPEALRMVPGIQVNRIDANKWGISARGFNGRFTNKLLVLIDGRTIYTPSFSFVYWEQQGVLLTDIDRIEVIRGPGATLWGANAVNGVINIITKSATETRGGRLVAGGGTEERAFGALRYGDELAPGTFARVYAKYNKRDSLVTLLGEDGDDEWDIGKGGFRIDSDLMDGDHITLQGDLYRSNLRQQLLVPDPVAQPTFYSAVDDRLSASGWNLLGRWERALSVTSDVSLQLYYDHTVRDEYYVGQRHDIVDLDFQHRVKAGQRHDIVWGLGYRNIDDAFENTEIVDLDPSSENRDLWSGFVQDDIELVPDRLRLTLGSKFEHNDYTGFEVQPNARLLWKAAEQGTVWGSVSRAVRTPSRAEQSAAVWARTTPTGASSPFPQSILVRTSGSTDTVSESLIAYELGTRFAPMPRLNLDLALFFNDYEELRTAGDRTITSDLSTGDYLVLDVPFDNRASGESYGIELAADFQVRDWWRLALAYSYLELDLQIDSGEPDASTESQARADPRQQLSLRSQMDPRDDIDFDLWLRYVDQSYPAFGVGLYGDRPIPAYWELDLRLAWRPRPDLELSITGQNLLHPSHQEGYHDAFSYIPLEVQRGVYAAFQYDF